MMIQGERKLGEEKPHCASWKGVQSLLIVIQEQKNGMEN